MNKNIIEICFIATDNYAALVATTAVSIIENTKEQLRFHVLTENFSIDNQEIIEDFLSSFPNVSVEFIDIAERLESIKGVYLSWFSSAIPYGRIFIPELIPFPKAIYMDVDIVFTSDIKELWEVDFYCDGKEYPLAAALDSVEFSIEDSNYIKNVLHLSPDHYFNSGLLVMNCDKWRKDHTIQHLLTILKESEIKFHFVDQDGFNIYFENNYLLLDKHYNIMPSYKNFYDRERYKNTKCLHYTTNKPWKPWKKCNQSEVFWKYARKTPYYEPLLLFYADVYNMSVRINKLESLRLIKVWKMFEKWMKKWLNLFLRRRRDQNMVGLQ
jgi:lipopolysaccharide biosynthesis glycosyltransferase